MSDIHQLIARLLYGLRLMECLRLRVKDIDFEQSQIFVREQSLFFTPAHPLLSPLLFEPVRSSPTPGASLGLRPPSGVQSFRMIYTHVLNRGGMAVRSPVDEPKSSNIRISTWTCSWTTTCSTTPISARKHEPVKIEHY